MKVAFGCDHGGFALKAALVGVLKDMGHEVTDCGCHCAESVDYPDFAAEVCGLVASGGCDRGVLVCGTGIGMSMAANRRPEIRAALCHELFTARLSREHNDANVLCLGARVVGPGLAEEMLRVWMETAFAGGRHLRRIGKFGRG